MRRATGSWHGGGLEVQIALPPDRRLLVYDGETREAPAVRCCRESPEARNAAETTEITRLLVAYSDGDRGTVDLNDGSGMEPPVGL